MKRRMNKLVQFIFMVNMPILLLAACGATKLTNTPTIVQIATLPTQLLPTSIPSYTHYLPSKELNIHLEFDYPSSWIRNETKYPDMSVIILRDPRYTTLPTPAPDDFHPIPNDFGLVRIRVIPNHTLRAEIDTHKKGSSDISWIKLMSDFKILVDGYEASVFEYQIQTPEIHSSLMFERYIFFAVEDQVYEITFLVAEKDLGGEFGQGYEYFFNSLDIIP